MISISTPRSPAPNLIECAPNLFLAGTIDMGNSIDWQAFVIGMLQTSKVTANIFNPRRANFSNEKSEERFQINWELDALFSANYIFMCFIAGSKSPISLLELGFLLPRCTKDNLIVVADESFYRWDNIQLTCARFNIKPYTSIRQGLDVLTDKLRNHYVYV